jgi:hypothetical protein
LHILFIFVVVEAAAALCFQQAGMDDEEGNPKIKERSRSIRIP